MTFFVVFFDLDCRTGYFLDGTRQEDALANINLPVKLNNNLKTQKGLCQR